MNNKQSPAQLVIERFGGQSALGILLGKRQSTIQHWAKTGRIPSQWHTRLMELAREKGINLQSSDLMASQSTSIQPPNGTLGVLLVGLGAVASTFISGVEHVRKGMGQPIGSLTQMSTIRLGKRSDNNTPLIRDFVPLATLEQPNSM